MRIRVNGSRLFFDVLGSNLEPTGPTMREKPTLILLHGGPGFDHSIYRPTFDGLADIAQVIYLDHRGQGRSDYGDSSQWNLAQWGDDVVGLCEALEITSPIVFGHSFGGMVAMAYATRHPEHAGGLILSGTYARQDRERVVERFSELGGPQAAEAARAFWSTPNAATTTQYNRLCSRHYTMRPAPIHTALRAIQRPEPCFHFVGGEMQTMDLLADLHRVRCRTLVLGAAGDPVCPIEGSEEIAAALPRQLARIARIEGCRHVFWADAPEAFFGLVREFVASH
jgi:pimeloyl-ACP methyl ester carboxylesterase